MIDQRGLQKSTKLPGKSLLIFPPAFEPNFMPPLGISFIASFLRMNGYKVDLLDMTVEPEKTPDWNQYSIVGMTLLCVNFDSAVNIAKCIRQENIDIRIIAGGPFADTCAKEVLETGFFDIVVHGEGEQALLQIIEAQKNGENFDSIKGLSLARDGKIISTEKRPLTEDLNNLPLPAYDLLDVENYEAFSIIASRGCPYHCIFCTRGPAESKQVRQLRPERVLEWIDLLVDRFDCKFVRFVDSTFTLNQQWAEKICDLIIQRDPKIRWECLTRIDCLNAKLLEKLKKAGCEKVTIGIETGNDEILTRLKKKFLKADVRIGAQLFKGANTPKLNLIFIIGHPWDTIKTVCETIKFAKELRRKFNTSFDLFLLTILPGTELWNNASKYGLKVTKNWKKFSKRSFLNNPLDLSASYDTRHFTCKELTSLYHFLAGPRIALTKKIFRNLQRAARQLLRGGYITSGTLTVAILPNAIFNFLLPFYRASRRQLSFVAKALKII